MIHVPKEQEYVLTQAERLAEAKITEARNVQSLQKIVKYEEERKASRKMLQMRRRHFGPLIRFTSSSRIRSSAVIDSNGIQTVDLATITTDQSLSGADAVSRVMEDDQIPALKTQPMHNFVSFHNFPEQVSTSAKELLLGTSNPAERPAVGPASPEICAISGLPAKYRDPVTGILYGNRFAYQVIQQIKTGQTPWNPVLTAYVPDEKCQLELLKGMYA